MLSQVNSRVSEETAMIMLCHEMKWDYWKYLAQPSWFIVGLRAKINTDINYRNRQQKKAERMSKSSKRR